MIYAINTEALVATVRNIVDRAEALLAMQGDNATPNQVAELFALGREIEDFSFELAHAATAMQILSPVAGRLWKRADACAEVYGTPAPTEGDFELTTSVGLQHFGLGDADWLDEGIPF
jgi:hypothetical protein